MISKNPHRSFGFWKPLRAPITVEDLLNSPTSLGTDESVETAMVSQMEDFTSSRAFRVAGPRPSHLDMSKYVS